MRIAEILKGLLLSWKYHVINCLEFSLTIEATWFQLSKQTTMKMMLLNQIQIALQESKELYPDQGDELDKGASSEVDNFHYVRKITNKHLSVGSVMKLLQHIAYQESALAFVKKGNKLCRAKERLIQLSGKKLPNPIGFVISSHMK